MSKALLSDCNAPQHPLALGLILALCGIHTAHAQQGNEQDAQTLDTILVTSQGRTEELQKAAAPIAVFSEVKIQDAGISSTADFVRLVPNMSYDTSFTVGTTYVSMRGIQQINNADAPIAVVVDGIPQNNQKEFRMDLFDIEQIEVLRGPQGALYGRNAVAGAIVINTKQPSNFSEGFFQAGIGGDGLRKLSGSSSGPIVEDRLFYRISMSANDFDGALNNSYLDEKVDWLRGHDLRGQLKWVPGEHQHIDWRVNSSRLRGGSVYNIIYESIDSNNANIWGDIVSDIPGRSDRQIDASSLKYHWDGAAMTLTSITGYTHIFEDYYADLDFCNPVRCPGGMYGTLGQVDQSQVLKVQQLSQELRLSSPSDASTQWTLGTYLLNTRRKLDSRAALVDPVPPVPLIASNESNRNRAWAVFGQIQFLMGDRDRLEISLRFDHDRRRQTDLGSGLVVNEGSWSAWQPKFTWSHDLNDRQMWYATAGRGFRSGGFNGIGGQPFAAENLTSYELGYKSSWLDNRLTFNSALFYEYDKDYQFFYMNVVGGQSQVLSNLSRVEIYGLETEVNWKPQPGWELFASLGLLDSYVKEVGVAESTTNLAISKGRRVPRSEPYSAVIGSQWNFPLGAYRGMYRFDVSRKGTRTWEADNLYLMDPVTLVNTRFTFFGSSRWNLTAWASNLFNRRYYTDFNSDGFGGLGLDLGFPAPGRRYGIEFRYDF